MLGHGRDPVWPHRSTVTRSHRLDTRPPTTTSCRQLLAFNRTAHRCVVPAAVVVVLLDDDWITRSGRRRWRWRRVATASGALIAESLAVGTSLERVPIVVDKVVRANCGDVSVGQPLTWTFIEFQVPVEHIEAWADTLSAVLDRRHGWYSDFRSLGPGLITGSVARSQPSTEVHRVRRGNRRRDVLFDLRHHPRPPIPVTSRSAARSPATGHSAPLPTGVRSAV
jgi:hypothetical protein